MGGGENDEKRRKDEHKAAKKKKKKPTHKPKVGDNEAASTDIRDVTDAARFEEESRKERMKKAPKNIKAKITNIAVEAADADPKTRITIDAGEVDGVEAGMKGYLVHNGKPYKAIELIKVNGGDSIAIVRTTRDDVDGKTVVLNPSR